MPNTLVMGLSTKQLRKAADLRAKIDGLERQLAAILVGGGGVAAAEPVSKPKRKMSAAAKAKISAAQKKRWAKEKAAKAKI
jgi:hypothetical protein